MQQVNISTGRKYSKKTAAYLASLGFERGEWATRNGMSKAGVKLKPECEGKPDAIVKWEGGQMELWNVQSMQAPNRQVAPPILVREVETSVPSAEKEAGGWLKRKLVGFSWGRIVGL